MPGSQYALFVQSKRRATLGTIRSASFFIGENGVPTHPFHLHLYAAGAQGQPGLDLLGQDIVVAAPRGNHWFTIDLTTYKIPAPSEGFFVAMEWIADNAQAPANTAHEGPEPEAQTLRPTFEFKESLTWPYAMGVGWQLLTLQDFQGQHFNAMAKAEVDKIR